MDFDDMISNANYEDNQTFKYHLLLILNQINLNLKKIDESLKKIQWELKN